MQPLEKLNFKAKNEEFLFARSAHIGGKHANLSVVNFNMPASGRTAAGERSLWAGSAGLSDGIEVTSVLNLNDALDNYKKFGVKFRSYSTTGITVIKGYREFYINQYKDMINGSIFCVLSVVCGVDGLKDYNHIVDTSTLTKMEVKSTYSIIEEIIGIY